MTHIRSFRNADLPVLVEIWIQHWSTAGPPPDVNTARFEQAVLARTFFDPSNLLLAESDGVVQAWCHFAAAVPSEATSPATAVIAALCALPSSDPALVDELLQAAETQMAERGLDRVCVGAVRDDQLGYAGLDPVGHGIAVRKADVRLTALLQEHGYRPGRSVSRMIASTSGYRPPVSRDALQLRRSSQIQPAPFQYRDTRHAAAMSHLDIEVEQLMDRSGKEIARVSLWLSDAEAEVMRPSMAILDIADTHQDQRLEPAESYLIGALIQSLVEHRVDTVETAVDSDQSELLAQLNTLHFQNVEEGVRWEKSLS